MGTRILFILMFIIFVVTGCSKWHLIRVEYTTLEEINRIHEYYRPEWHRELSKYEANPILGLYIESTRTIYCMENDHLTCGHELRHVVQPEWNHEDKREEKWNLKK